MSNFSKLSSGLILIFVVLSKITFSQEIEIIEQYPGPLQHSKSFEYIDPDYDLSKTKLIARFKGYSINTKKENFAHLFNDFWKTANSMSANSFKIDSVTRKNDTSLVFVSIYFLTEDELKNNFDLYPKNKVFIYGDLVDRENLIKKIKINKESVTLNPLEYVSYQNEIDKEIKVNIGGFLGATTWIKGYENRLPTHLSLSNFGIGPYIGYNSIGVTVNTGRIYPVELNMGQFLIQVLKEAKTK